MSMNISGKTVWLIGASSGIGFSMAEELASKGNFVIVTARNIHSLDMLKAKFNENIAILEGDITDTYALENLKNKLNGISDIIDLLILCAGTCEYDDGPELQIDMYRRVFEINFFAAISCIKIALPLLKRAKGRIVGVSSLACVVPFPRAEAYGASKAAFEYMLQALSIDLKEQGVKITVARPGFVKTPLTDKNDFDMPYIMAPKEAANAILKGINDEKSIISFPWQLSFPIHLFSYFKSVWLRLFAVKFRKINTI